MRRTQLLGIAVVCGAAGCTESIAYPSGNEPALYLRFAPESAFVGYRVRVTAVATGDDSVAVAWPRFEWSSSDTSVAVVDSTGVVLGLSPGTTRISARLGALRDSMVVRVVALDVSRGTAFASMAAGDRQLCALSTRGVAYCVRSGYQQMGTAFEMLPGADTLQLATLAGSRSQQCGVAHDGRLFCWGDNSEAQLMTGSRDAAEGPVLSGAGSRFVAVATAAAGSENPTTAHTCAIQQGTGVVICAGSNGTGQLGRGVAGTDFAVQPVLNPFAAHRIAAAASRTCALAAAGTELWCWGAGAFSTVFLAPERITGVPPFTDLTMNDNQICARRAGGLAYCGTSWSGLGSVPGNLRFNQIVPGRSFDYSNGGFRVGEFGCGVTTANDLACWGDFPPLAISSRYERREHEPVHLLPGIKVRSIGVNEYHVCGVSTDDRLLCL